MKKVYLLLLPLLSFATLSCRKNSDADSQPVIIINPDQVILQITSLPETTPVDEPIYVVGNFNNWDMDSKEFMLRRGQKNIPTIIIPRTDSGILEYKFTRGYSNTEERLKNYMPFIRKHEFDTDHNLVQADIALWADIPFNINEEDYPTPNEDEILFIIKVPKNTPRNDHIYMIGDFNGHKVADNSYRLKRNENDGFYYFLFKMKNPEQETFTYNFNRGSWQTYEKYADGSHIDRTYNLHTDGQRVKTIIGRWADSPNLPSQ
jgi:hypothetical protein